jgi:valyl-tRNA synthetase
MIARIMRMCGFNVYFAPGYDDNGLPTEKYVEEKLGINKAETNRVEFRKLCLKESERVEKVYTENVFKKLGHTYDWDLLYQTISPESQKVAQTAFLKLVKKKECYRAKEPTIWCPYHETALAQAEVEDLKRSTELNYIEFGDQERVVIATTRPEFLASCVGIFVHPDDKRYKDLIGKEITVPLFNYKVKVMEDETVDPEFGTGIMMVCTFGDNADIEKWKKYKLDLKIMMDKKGRMNNLGGKYKGMSLEEARKTILEDLQKQGRIKKKEILEQTVGSCWRCNTPVEYIVTDQWFIHTLKHKKELIKRGKEIKWYPEFMRMRYESWVKNLGWDWAISRQRFYGVPIPVWYCENCKETIFPEEKELPIDPLEEKRKCKKCKQESKPEQDVFDTWMTSSNSPEVALRWLEKPEQYKKLSPMSLRPQSHDIIRTWAFYTILKSHLLFHRIPWKDIAIGTFVLDPKGRGMSKSKGNAIWADDLIEKYGVDVFRYWVGGANFGNDLPFNEKELIAGKKLLTKIWNASNFVIMNLKGYNKLSKKKINLEEIDKYQLQKTNKMIKKTKEQYLKYDISGARRTVEKFFWNMFCDNYLEIVKKRIYQNKKGKESAQKTLYTTLLEILKLFSPITSFITEEIYKGYFEKYEKEKSIHLMEFEELGIKESKKNLQAGDLFMNILAKVRQIKTKAKKSMKAEIVLTFPKEEQEKIKEMLEDLKDVTNASEIKEGKFNVEFSG